MADRLYGYTPRYGGDGLSSSNSYSRLSIGSYGAYPYTAESSLLSSSRCFGLVPVSGIESSKVPSIDRSLEFLRFPGNGNIGILGVSGDLAASGTPGGIGGLVAPSLSQASWPGVGPLQLAATEPAFSGFKRSADALYPQTLLVSHNAVGQSEALVSSNSLAKRSRPESASSLPVYPQRPGTKDCAHYMLTRTCKYGEKCIFDHPPWVPEGGIPDWKEPIIPDVESLPERPGEPDCPYLNPLRCKFGPKCKFNHPKDKINNGVLGASETPAISVLPERPSEPAYSVPSVPNVEFYPERPGEPDCPYLDPLRCNFGPRCKFNHPKDKIKNNGLEGASEIAVVSVLPEHPSEPTCSYYMKTGRCKFGAICKFHHPKDIVISSAGQEPSGQTVTGDSKPAKPAISSAPALLHNSKGLPIRPGEADCPFYLKTGSCKFGSTCHYNHPDLNAFNLPVAGVLGHSLTPSTANLLVDGINPAKSVIPNIDPRLDRSLLGLGQTVYPQRPGQMECDYFMKTGHCKFAVNCKFHHPVDRSAASFALKQEAVEQSVKLTLAGLPRRADAKICRFYMNTGICDYGVTCKFDHPPPGEVISKALTKGLGGEKRNSEASNSDGEEEEGVGGETEDSEDSDSDGE